MPNNLPAVNDNPIKGRISENAVSSLIYYREQENWKIGAG